MLLFRQLELTFDRRQIDPANRDSAVVAEWTDGLQPPAGRDHSLEKMAREILNRLDASALGEKLRVEWNARLRSCAGRADWRRSLISLNPRLAQHSVSEVERTFRHELAHLLAQFRAGRRRIHPHGSEWREACRDLEIGDETRCHNLPFPVSRLPRRFHYRCPNCQREFGRVRKIRRAIACLACCRKYNGGRFDARFRLTLRAAG